MRYLKIIFSFIMLFYSNNIVNAEIYYSESNSEEITSNFLIHCTTQTRSDNRWFGGLVPENTESNTPARTYDKYNMIENYKFSSYYITEELIIFELSKFNSVRHNKVELFIHLEPISGFETYYVGLIDIKANSQKLLCTLLKSNLSMESLETVFNKERHKK